ncbi:MAG: hypothetical protein WCB57_15220 [Pseudonocardiaceae bacterium]
MEANRKVLLVAIGERGAFALCVLENSISRDDQIAFGRQLVDLANAIRERSRRTPGLIIDGSTDRKER